LFVFSAAREKRRLEVHDMKPLLILVLLFGVSLFAGAQSTVETKHHRDERIRWWREARFDMFIA
jgi:hypothetical protein